jgi:hypothetical protein
MIQYNFKTLTIYKERFRSRFITAVTPPNTVITELAHTPQVQDWRRPSPSPDSIQTVFRLPSRGPTKPRRARFIDPCVGLGPSRHSRSPPTQLQIHRPGRHAWFGFGHTAAETPPVVQSTAESVPVGRYCQLPAPPPLTKHLLFPRAPNRVRTQDARLDGESGGAVQSSAERHGCCCCRGDGGVRSSVARPPAPRDRPRRLLAVPASPAPARHAARRRAGTAEAGVVRVLAHHAPGLLPLRPTQGWPRPAPGLGLGGAGVQQAQRPAARVHGQPAGAHRRGGGRRPHQARAGGARAPDSLADAPPRRRLPPHAQPPLRHVLDGRGGTVTAASAPRPRRRIARGCSNVAATVLLATFFLFDSSIFFPFPLVSAERGTAIVHVRYKFCGLMFVWVLAIISLLMVRLQPF